MMTDKDKIIKAIKCRAERNKHCGNPCEETGNCHYAKCVVGLDGEPYYPFVCDTEQLCTDALTLLKEQEAVKPVRDKETGRLWLCGNCGSYVGFEDNDPYDQNEFDKFCRECGRPVLWEGR